ncbi:hypothetical protein O6H91_03G011000 [Diphasiastrum complanatum]|uniref:Uncharacterized protein n=2 Tax=Diphasiastrum complanatum TaxID=34168 RepID=A0ACC2E3E2_DIPCM|nr:hypothetical protein O6H91_03G011000 [Diphasiastrum complanatum]KAJ7561030.1 hypothetical protein O6H91_03G011000 [Diphasiastrum complanatum]
MQVARMSKSFIFQPCHCCGTRGLSRMQWINGSLTTQGCDTPLTSITPMAVDETFFSWSKAIAISARDGNHRKVLDLFRQMTQAKLKPDKFTFLRALKACSKLALLQEGKQTHSQLRECGFESDIFVGSCLIDMYGKCRSIEDARTVFDSIRTHDTVCWNAIISSYVNCGHARKALGLFERMQRENLKADSFTFVAVLKACTIAMALEEGRHIHEQVIVSGFESNVVVGSCLIDMYIKCGEIDHAYNVFNSMSTRDVVIWNTLISGCVKSEKHEIALELFYRMQQEGLQPDSVTFVGALNACACLAALDEGRLIHKKVIGSGLECDVLVGSCLVDMYGKCSSILDASRVFNNMPKHNLVSWNSMITGYVKCGQEKEAIELFQQMNRANMMPDSYTFVAVLNACASITALQEGRRIHAQIIQSGFESEIIVGNCLLDMYGRCGCVQDALRVFNSMKSHDIVSWNAMLRAYAMHGRGKEAVRHFDKMCHEDSDMDSVTFVCILSACSHAGLVEDGHYFFASMLPIYGLPATMENYGCMVDLLGRAGWLDEAEAIVNMIDGQPTINVLTALLGACRVHGDVKMGERIAERILELDPGNASSYMLLSHTYAATGKWDYRENIDTEG